MKGPAIYWISDTYITHKNISSYNNTKINIQRLDSSTTIKTHTTAVSNQYHSQ